MRKGNHRRLFSLIFLQGTLHAGIVVIHHTNVTNTLTGNESPELQHVKNESRSEIHPIVQTRPSGSGINYYVRKQTVREITELIFREIE